MRTLLLLSAVLLTATRAFSQCSSPSYNMELNVNNVKARIMNGGDMWWDLISHANYEVPQGSAANALFAAALWIGGLDQNGQLHVAAQTYRQNGIDYFPGPLDLPNATTSSSVCSDFDRMWNVYGSEINAVIQAWDNSGGIELTQADIPFNVLHWPAKGNPFNTVVGSRNLAPFFDRDGDGAYDPTKGDYPALAFCTGSYADQMIWWVFNDNGGEHTESEGLPLGIEVHAMAYAFQTNDAINDQTFYRFKIINRSSDTFHDLYAGLWIDPDLGNPIDDNIGCDTSHNMGITYNMDSYDEPGGSGGSYNNQPPLTGIKVLNNFFGDPSVRPMSHFMYYNNDFTITGNPENMHEYYYYLKSLYKDGTHLTQGGVQTDYAFPGDPTDSLGWSQCSQNDNAADRRMVIGSGPASLQPGESRTLDYAVVFVQPPVGYYAPCPSFAMLQSAALLSQLWYDGIMCVDNTVGINPLSQTRFAIHPNPAVAGNNVFLSISETGNAEVFDMTGRLIYDQLISGNDNLGISELSEGCYIIRFTTHQGVSYHSKLIVQ